MLSKPDFHSVLRDLKGFQRRTVDYVFNRLYLDSDSVNRFLIADEVGLGKTLVAKGIIARSLDYLWDKIERLDIIYVCSNADIARQNINRLKISTEGFSLASRITMLPQRLNELTTNKINFVSFTPGTSFNLRSSTGIKTERALIYSVLREAWDLGDEEGPINLMQCSALREGWRSSLDYYIKNVAPGVDAELKQGFVQALGSKLELRTEFMELARRFADYEKEEFPREMYVRRNRLIGNLRMTLATCCIHALKPDIIILDEFQRFKHLLDDQDPMSKLAQYLFNYRDESKPVDTKILLLSATPYKMYTTYHGAAEDDHYCDFLRTLGFLLNSKEQTGETTQLLQEFRRSLYSFDTAQKHELSQAKAKIEANLRKVMVRTERLGVSQDRNGMVQDCRHHCEVRAEDLLGFANLDSICYTLGAGDHLELWKSSPYLLSFADEYALKKKLKARLQEPDHYDELAALISRGSGVLRWSRIRYYKSISPENPRLRKLIEQNLDAGWNLLWVPPSLPYYEPGGDYASSAAVAFTKTLLFSSWKVVPKAVAAICSYEAERRAITTTGRDVTYLNTRDRIAPLLQFSLTDGRYTGMPALALLYPCLTLAEKVDPLRIAIHLGKPPTQQEVMDRAESIIKDLFCTAVDVSLYPDRGPVDERWYWAALAFLDRHFHSDTIKRWLEHKDNRYAFAGMIEGKDEGEGRFADHARLFAAFFDNPHELGRMPNDLFRILAKFSLGSPAITSLRSLGRKDLDIRESRCLAAACRIAVGFRSMFNLPESIAIVRRTLDRVPYWECVLDYAIAGNLQAVLDEYVHVMYESLGLMTKSNDEETADTLREAIYHALSIRTTRTEFDDIRLHRKKRVIALKNRSIRCRYALRLQESRTEDGDVTREDQVRAAFNSPFRPFVLATTSIGQEGLDFHQYCHAIFHWNLPSNPVDLEQREGRIHRYKGHVIRKNLAKHYGLSGASPNKSDPWDDLFAQAARDRMQLQGNDLVPYWIFETGKGFKIERHLPVLPFSREIPHIDRLKRGLVLYRMVFGQPRQEDLLDFLQRTVDDAHVADVLNHRINLEP